jgi:hypothetical protein
VRRAFKLLQEREGDDVDDDVNDAHTPQTRPASAPSMSRVALTANVSRAKRSKRVDYNGKGFITYRSWQLLAHAVDPTISDQVGSITLAFANYYLPCLSIGSITLAFVNHCLPCLSIGSITLAVVNHCLPCLSRFNHARFCQPLLALPFQVQSRSLLSTITCLAFPGSITLASVSHYLTRLCYQTLTLHSFVPYLTR